VRLLIVGLGVIGTAYGWAFSQAGAEVVHLVRPGRKAGLAGGVELDLLDRRPGHDEHRAAHYLPAMVEDVSPGDRFDLVMAPVKHYQLAGTVRELAPKLPDSGFLLFAANWDGPAAIDEALPRSRYVWGYAASTGGHAGGRLLLNMSDSFRFGPIDGLEPPCYRTVLDLFAAADVRPDLKPDMIEWLWVHFAQAAGSIAAALFAGGQQALLEDERALRDVMVPSVRDALAVLARRGVDPAAWPDTRPFVERPAEELAAAARRSADSEWVRRTFVAGHFGENLEEMKRFYFDVLETGERLGVDMPQFSAMKERIVALV